MGVGVVMILVRLSGSRSPAELLAKAFQSVDVPVIMLVFAGALINEVLAEFGAALVNGNAMTNHLGDFCQQTRDD